MPAIHLPRVPRGAAPTEPGVRATIAVVFVVGILSFYVWFVLTHL